MPASTGETARPGYQPRPRNRSWPILENNFNDDAEKKAAPQRAQRPAHQDPDQEAGGPDRGSRGSRSGKRRVRWVKLTQMSSITTGHFSLGQRGEADSQARPIRPPAPTRPHALDSATTHQESLQQQIRSIGRATRSNGCGARRDALDQS
jgi:hypothetical protein